MVVVFIGSNPSVKSASIIPFYRDTKSLKVIEGWFDKLGETPITTIHFLNVSNAPTVNNRPLKVSEIKANLDNLNSDIEGLNPDKIVTLGRTAEKALTLLRREFYAMPHPSGLNRQLNDPTFVEEKISGLRVYLSPPKESK